MGPLTERERHDYMPPPCPFCGGATVVSNWIDVLKLDDDPETAPRWFPGAHQCRDYDHGEGWLPGYREVIEDALRGWVGDDEPPDPKMDDKLVAACARDILYSLESAGLMIVPIEEG